MEAKIRRTNHITDELHDEVVTNNVIFPIDTDESVTFTSHASANTFCAWAEIVDNNAVTLSSKFAAYDGHITNIMVESNDGADDAKFLYELSYGAAKTLIRSGRCVSNGSGATKETFQTVYGIGTEVPSGETIYYRIKCSTGGKLITVHLSYFLYVD